MQEEYIPHYEIYHNRRWSLLEAERVSDKSIVLLLVYSHREVLHVGLANIRRKFEKFYKMQQTLGNIVVLRASITAYNKNIAIVFDSGQKQKVPESFISLSQCSPITALSDYLETVLNILGYFSVIHKGHSLHNCVNINGFVTHVGDQNNVQLLDMGDMMDVNAISTGQARLRFHGEQPGQAGLTARNLRGLDPKDKESDALDIESASGDGSVDTLEKSRVNKEYLEELVDYRYASPEQTGRTEGIIDRRSEIYSLGVLMYELAVGTVPFDSNDMLEVIHSHMTQPTPNLPATLWDRPDVRNKISTIIQKMMSKAPQDRYQSLFGVIRDLENLQVAVRTHTDASDFIIGTHDLEDEVNLGKSGSAMYGREQQKQQITEFLENFELEGKAGLIAIRGHSGVGKSTLVQYIFTQLRQKKDSEIMLLSGKHERLKKTPYSVFVDLVGDLVRRLLTLPAQELATWSTTLNAALEPNGQVLIDFIPEIRGVIGIQPSVPTLPPNEARQRFENVFITFCKSFLANYTVILFFDDIQWADSATMSLMENLLTNTTIRNFLVIVAYRGADFRNDDPLKISLDNMLNTDAIHSLTLELGDLMLSDVKWIVQDCFQCNDQDRIHVLANLLFQKTRGNPFFLCQLLRSITNEEYVKYNYQTHEWEWSIEELSKVQFTENVIEFLVAQIKKLPQEAQIVAQTAACLGSKFNSAAILEILPEYMVSTNLPLLISNGFVHPEGELVHIGAVEVTFFRFVHDRVQEAFYSMMDADDRRHAHLKIARLKKKRYQSESAAFARSGGVASSVQRSRTLGDIIPRDMLFTVVSHYNAAIELIVELDDNNEERRQVMILNIEAAWRAKRSGAIEAAYNYLRHAQRAMPSHLMTSDYVTWFNLHHFLAESLSGAGEISEAEKLFETMLAHAREDRDRVRVYILMINAHFSTGNLSASVEAAQSALRLNNIELPNPDDATLADMVNDVIEAQQAQSGDDILGLLNVAEADEDYQLTIEVLHSAIPVAFTLVQSTSMNFFYATIALICKLSISKGMTVYSANGIACFSSYLCLLRKKESYDYGLLALRLQEKRPHPGTLPRTKANFVAFAQWQQESPQACHATILSAYRSGIEVGDSLYSLYATLILVSYALMVDHIEDSEPQFTQMLTVLRSAKALHPAYVDSVFAICRTFSLLRGTTMVDGEFDDFDPMDHYDTLDKMNAYFFIAPPFYVIITTYILIEDYAKALELDEKVPLRYLGNSLLYYDYLSWSCLLHLAVLPYNSARKEESRVHIDIVEKYMKELDFVSNSPVLSAQITLCKAEMSRVQGEPSKGLMMYNQAIERAKAIPSQRLIGYASERVMNFYISQKKEKQAVFYFREARAAYFAWGAYVKTRQLELKYNSLVGHNDKHGLAHTLAANNSVAAFAQSPLQTPEAALGRTMDRTSVLQACQVLSSEMDFSKLLIDMVRIVIQNSGAQRGILIIPDEEGKLFVEVQGDANGDYQFQHIDVTSHMPPLSPPASPRLSSNAVQSPNVPLVIPHSPNVSFTIPHSPPTSIKATHRLSSPSLIPSEGNRVGKPKGKDGENQKEDQEVKSKELDGKDSSESIPPASSLLPIGIIHYVYKTKLSVMLADASKEGGFSHDQHVQQNNTKSVLCVPALYQSRVVAILYVENNLISGAFTPEKLEVVQMLSTQIAISFSNAKLYNDLQDANRLLAQKNKALIEFDQIKDQFLANTSHELRTPLNGIIGLAESLLETGTDHANAPQTLSMIVNCGKRLSSLVNDIMDYNSLRIGKLNFNPRPTELSRNVAEVVSVSIPLIGTKKIAIVNKVKKLPAIRCDPARIQQVLQNVIGNAIKFTEEGQITVDSEVTDDWVSLIVSDTGCGIPENQYHIIFEEFKQVDGSISREVGGTGLGLPISKKIVEMHRGAIYFESEVGKGSTFRIALPNISRSGDSPPVNIRGTPNPQASRFSPSTPHISPSPHRNSPSSSSSLSATSPTIPPFRPSTPLGDPIPQSPLPVGLPRKASISPSASFNIPFIPPRVFIPAISVASVATQTPSPLTIIKPLSSSSSSSVFSPLASSAQSSAPSFSSDPLPPPQTYLEGKSALPLELTSENGTPEFTVLSVDDDNSNQIVIKKLLGKKFSIVTAMSGPEALNKMDGGLLPDFILLDVMMPKMSGLEVCEILRKKYPVHQLPIIMVSAKSKPADIVAGLTSGANDYVGKPINKDELLARMTTHLTMSVFCRSVSAGVQSPCVRCIKPGMRQTHHFLYASSNLMEILDLLPFSVTVYDMDTNVIFRNKRSTEIYDALGTTETKSTFMPHAKLREQADSILASVKQSLVVDEDIAVVYGGMDLLHRLSARPFTVTNKEEDMKATFILLTEELAEPRSQNGNSETTNGMLPPINSEIQTTANSQHTQATQTPAPAQILNYTTTQQTQTEPANQHTNLTSQFTSSASQTSNPLTPPMHTRSSSPRNPPAASPNLLRASPRTARPPSISSRNPHPRHPSPTSPRIMTNNMNNINNENTNGNANNSNTQSTISNQMNSTPLPASTTLPPATLLKSSSSSSLGDAHGIMNMDQVLDYVDTLHDYITDLEQDKRKRGEFVPQVLRSASLPSTFKQRSRAPPPASPLSSSSSSLSSRPHLPLPPVPRLPLGTPLPSSFAHLQQHAASAQQNHSTAPYIIPTPRYNPAFLVSPIPSPRTDLPNDTTAAPTQMQVQTQTQEDAAHAPYFTRSSYNTPSGTPLSSSRSYSSDIPYFTLSSFPSMESIPDAMLPRNAARGLFTSSSTFSRGNLDTSSPRSTSSRAPTRSYTSSVAHTPVPSALSLRQELHELQAQIYLRQAQLAAFLRIKFRVTNSPLPNGLRTSQNLGPHPPFPNRHFSQLNRGGTLDRERNNLLASLYLTIEIPEARVQLLYGEVAVRLEVQVDSILALVKNGDTLVSIDEDVEDGMAVDVYLDE